ncbi:helix-turn-helix domain-containing protein [Companilactobacillus zhachilii]|uniref:Helix-turn-helix domain-containing protein n=1 Tax=Companilactobacillus zhachilii TaxID=2304606 RepID=A0A386PWC1_9LACO|nr:helix-turn-helix domain-containing protein [Companilactobacillus zhachilii]AYE38767.1 helix-turn-helix domain-containing protein [Companilactobacillus zhachilii]
MELNEQLKKYRQQENLTQKQLAMKLNVSDKTISSWETNRTYPDISLLINLSSVLNVSLDELLKGDTETVEKIDKDLKLKKTYKHLLIVIGVLLVIVGGGYGFLSQYQYENELVDRFNPLLKTKIGYAALPTEKTAIDSDYIEMKVGPHEKKKVLGSPFKNMVVTDDSWGTSSFLTFYTGLPPVDKPYVMVEHRGIYVSRINFVDWESIPRGIRNNMFKDYSKYRGMYIDYKKSQKSMKGNYDPKTFVMNVGQYD